MDEVERRIIRQCCVKAASALHSGSANASEALATAQTFERWVNEGVSIEQAVANVQSTPPAQPQTVGQMINNPVCPKCGGAMWDNRPKKASGQYKPTAADFACKNKSCDGRIWPS